MKARAGSAGLCATIAKELNSTTDSCHQILSSLRQLTLHGKEGMDDMPVYVPGTQSVVKKGKNGESSFRFCQHRIRRSATQNWMVNSKPENSAKNV